MSELTCLELGVLHDSPGIWPTVWVVARALFNVIHARSLVRSASFVAIVIMPARRASA